MPLIKDEFPAFSTAVLDTDHGQAPAVASLSPPRAVSNRPEDSVNSGNESVGTNPSDNGLKKRNRRVGHKIASNKYAKIAASTATTFRQNRKSGNGNTATSKPLSKHDERWNEMFDKLKVYKRENNSTQVPQCYDQDARLGRWVHYQRVEYWLYQSSGKGKISLERIASLEGIGFEWDPQGAQWNVMFKKLRTFALEHGHCCVPKGYTKDTELANWVRNQRLEFVNLQKGKKSRMTQERINKLNGLNFQWSPISKSRAKTAADPEQTDTKEQKTSVAHALKPGEKGELGSGSGAQSKKLGRNYASVVKEDEAMSADSKRSGKGKK